MISSGINEIDEFLDGGLKNGLIIDIFGAAGTGKTQLALQIALDPLIQNKQVLLQDTTGNFRPERLQEILTNRKLSPDLLDNLHVIRALNTSDQIKKLSSILEKNNYSLVIIDNLTDLFSFEYAKKDYALEKKSVFMKYMRHLSQIAHSQKIPIIVTNMIRFVDKNEVENLEKLVDLYSHIKIKLGKNGNLFYGSITSINGKLNFNYSITLSGIVKIS